MDNQLLNRNHALENEKGGCTQSNRLKICSKKCLLLPTAANFISFFRPDFMR